MDDLMIGLDGVTFRDELTYKHVEDWFKDMRRRAPTWSGKPWGEVSGDYIRAALKAGIISGNEINPSQMHASVVVALAKEIDKRLGEAQTVDAPES